MGNRNISMATSVKLRRAIEECIDSIMRDVSELEREHQIKTFQHYEIMGDKIAVVSDQLQQLKKILVLEGHLNGMSNKKMAEIFQVSPARISQLLKEAKET